MTIYQIGNLSGKPDFIVPDQATADSAGIDNPYIRSVAIGTEADAQAKLAQNQTEFMVQNEYRFNICFEQVDGNDTIWRTAEDTDPEVAVYKVFNTFTGQYTTYQSLSEAKAANESLKQEVLTAYGMGSITTVDALPKKPAQPKSSGAQSL